MTPFLKSLASSGAQAGLSGIFDTISSIGANKRMMKFWKMQNEYNHPRNQISRLKSAGLNPALMYGGSASGASGMAGSIGSPERPRISVDNPMQHIGKFADIRFRNVQTSNEQRRGNLIVQESALKAAQTAAKNLENAKTKRDWDANEKLKNISVDVAEQNLLQEQEQTFKMNLENSVRDVQLRNELVKDYYQIKLMKQTGHEKAALIALRRQQIHLMKEGLHKAPWYAQMLKEQLDAINPDMSDPTVKDIVNGILSQRPSRKSETWRKRYKPTPIKSNR